jgi:hypothetical protein
MAAEVESPFVRRLGPDPHENGTVTYAAQGCPDIWEIEGGDFAIIGSDITADVVRKLPASANCGPDEKIVRIPRKTLVLAKRDIPDDL